MVFGLEEELELRSRQGQGLGASQGLQAQPRDAGAWESRPEPSSLGGPPPTPAGARVLDDSALDAPQRQQRDWGLQMWGTPSLASTRPSSPMPGGPMSREPALNDRAAASQDAHAEPREESLDRTSLEGIGAAGAGFGASDANELSPLRRGSEPRAQEAASAWSLSSSAAADASVALRGEYSTRGDAVEMWASALDVGQPAGARGDGLGDGFAAESVRTIASLGAQPSAKREWPSTPLSRPQRRLFGRVTRALQRAVQVIGKKE